MVARILSLLLGLMLSPIGWAIVDPKGPAASRMPPLDLGMFEGHRVFIGWGLLALGIAALLSSVLPKTKPKPKGPPMADFDAAPEVTTVSDHHEEPAHHDGHEHHEEAHHDDEHDHEPHGDAHGHHVSSSGSPRPSALW
ncbi:MAG: hypothetical protein ACOYM5_07865 [Caulobacter sp.]